MPSPHHSDGERVEEWPVVKLFRPPATDKLGVVEYEPSVRRSGSEIQTYHPESAPNVLSPEEAQLVAKAFELVGLYVPDVKQITRSGEAEYALWKRLETYGKEHHAD